MTRTSGAVAAASKKRSEERIDGIVALVMAIKRRHATSEPEPSTYETRGLLVVG